MSSISKGLEGAGKGFALGWQLGEGAKRTKVSQGHLDLAREKYEDEKMLRILQGRVADKQADNKKLELELEKKKMIVNFLPSLMGEEGISPKRKDSIVKSMKEQTGFDISEFFRPETNEKDGVIKSYSLHNIDSLNNKLDNEANLINANAAKLNAASMSLQEKRKTIEMNADPMLFIQNEFNKDDAYKKASPSERIDMVSEKMQQFDASMSAREAVMEAGTKKQIELDMYSKMKKIDDVKRVADTYSKDFLTWPGKIKNWKIDKILKAGTTVENIYGLSDEERKYAKDFARFHASINRLFVGYVHDMSGAQYSIKEMETHKKSLFNPDQNYEAFRGVYNDFVADIKKGYRIRKQILTEGFMGDAKALGDAIQTMYMLPSDPTQSTLNKVNRMNQLGAMFDAGSKKYTQEEKEAIIFDTMVSEGYDI